MLQLEVVGVGGFTAFCSVSLCTFECSTAFRLPIIFIWTQISSNLFPTLLSFPNNSIQFMSKTLNFFRFITRMEKFSCLASASIFIVFLHWQVKLVGGKENQFVDAWKASREVLLKEVRAMNHTRTRPSPRGERCHDINCLMATQAKDNEIVVIYLWVCRRERINVASIAVRKFLAFLVLFVYFTFK